MVPSTRAETGADRVRPLNLPQPVQVHVDAGSGLPLVLHERGRSRRIAHVQDVWHVDDEWWREPISRRYLQVVLADGSLRTLFHDHLTDRWFAQTY